MDFLNKGIDIISEAIKVEWDNSINKIEESEVIEKIESHLARTGINANPKDILKIIKNDKTNFLFSMFCKNPIRENFTENFVFNEIKNCGVKFKKCENYHSSVKKYMCGREEISDNNSDKNIKTIDYEFELEDGRRFLCNQKYTSGRGSPQDDRFNEIRHFIESNRKIKDKNIIPVALIDGAYYKRSKRGSKLNNFDSLREKSFCGDVLVMPYLEFIDKLKKNEF